jgi:hypothetical protein
MTEPVFAIGWLRRLVHGDEVDQRCGKIEERIDQRR